MKRGKLNACILISVLFLLLTTGCGGDNPDRTTTLSNASTNAAWRLFAVSPGQFSAFPASIIWAAADDDVFAADDGGRVYHYDGKRWKIMESINTGSINDVWGLSSDDVYAAGRGGVYHYDGTRWQLMPGSEVNADNWSIWGSGPDDLFVPGNGRVFHYDGSTWETMDIPGAFTLWEIWGTASDDVFAVGNRGGIFHFDGSTWTAMDSGISSAIGAIWGAASDDVYASGPDNAVLHYDGVDWSPIAISGTATDIWGSTADNVYVSTASSLLLYNGTEWQQVSTVGSVAIWGGGTKVFSANYSSLEDIRPEVGFFEGSNYTSQFIGTPSQIYTVAGSNSNNVFIGGLYSLGLLYDGQDWQSMQRTGVGLQTTFDFAWVVDENNIVAGSNDQIKYYDGFAWQLPITISGANFQDAWAASENDYFLAAGAGLVYHFNSSAGLEEMTTPSSENLNGIWGFSNNDVYAVGNQGTILHYDGSSWLEVDHPATDNLTAIWGSGPEDIYVVGESGIILHYNGTDWNIMAADQFSLGFKDIWGITSDNIYAIVGNTVVHYDGTNWSIIDTGYKMFPNTVWASDSENVYIADKIQGFVYRYSQ